MLVYFARSYTGSSSPVLVLPPSSMKEALSLPCLVFRHLDRLLTDAYDLLSLDYTCLPMDVESKVTVSPSTSGTLHAVAIWVDYQLDETSRWSTFGGGRGDGVSRRRGWVHDKQMIRWLAKPVVVDDAAASCPAAVMTISGRFDVEGGCMSFEVVER